MKHIAEIDNEIQNETEAETETVDEIGVDEPLKEPGFIKFYGLYWRKSAVDWSENKLLGQPKGWMGRGKVKTDYDYSQVQMNFWNQKGVYVLYDANLHPVYAGQAGRQSGQSPGRTLGSRLSEHSKGIYRNGWELFSWFGFLHTKKINLKTAQEGNRLKPVWTPTDAEPDKSFNRILSSFEAVLIEGFAPRFNSRGGDLKGATLVDQFDPAPSRP